MWADARKANAPSGLLGRAGQEHTRTTASEMMERQAHWPFHLAGDSGARLFNHRAWLSWRFLALLELPSLTLSELPVLSDDLQALIAATRSSAETGESWSAETVHEVLLRFLHDPAWNHLRGMWLRRALKLTKHIEDTVLEEQYNCCIEKDLLGSSRSSYVIADTGTEFQFAGFLKMLLL